MDEQPAGPLRQAKVKRRVRFSLDNLKLDDVLNIPLFMADQTERLIGLALETRNSYFRNLLPYVTPESRRDCHGFKITGRQFSSLAAPGQLPHGP